MWYNISTIKKYFRPSKVGSLSCEPLTLVQNIKLLKKKYFLNLKYIVSKKYFKNNYN